MSIRIARLHAMTTLVTGIPCRRSLNSQRDRSNPIKTEFAKSKCCEGAYLGRTLEMLRMFWWAPFFGWWVARWWFGCKVLTPVQPRIYKCKRKRRQWDTTSITCLHLNFEEALPLLLLSPKLCILSNPKRAKLDPISLHLSFSHSSIFWASQQATFIHCSVRQPSSIILPSNFAIHM